jgi:recombinational DNA repair protein RecR
MGKRENEIRKNSLKFSGKDIVLAGTMLEKLEKSIEIIYYLMEQEAEESFVLMLITAKDVEMYRILDASKRDTDILFEIDKDESIYVMLCQDTKVDGGYHFAERIIKSLLSQKGTDIYCTELEVRTTHYKVQHVIMKLIQTFLKSKAEEKVNQIVYKSLN